jgi:hypothetical protein
MYSFVAVIYKLGNIQKAHHANSTFGFCDTKANAKKNQKSCFFANARQKDEIV